jgi:MYXO-CTERM domain-containing protein
MITGCKRAVSWLALSGILATVSSAHAFCGFYVTGADASLYANATTVVLMRDGMRTVLSMQNNYQGPPEGFALVIPVPSVLQKQQVQTLSNDVFKHVDTLGAPRLVEYWETDPCEPWIDHRAGGQPTADAADAAVSEGSVTVEAQFKVGEYDIVILSANDSSGLESWLIKNEYNIPVGAKDVLDPYVAAGTKFFVAKVDPSLVMFRDGQAALSPLRFYYDAAELSLPVRLGLLNSHGTQDLIVSILAPSRYELANHPNARIPTNIRVQDEVRNSFAGFYEALFAKTLASAPKNAVVTEYAWNANTCDPCPTPALTPEDLATLGADITQGLGPDQPFLNVDYVLTRLHYRYTTETLGDDLIFQEAPPLVGGRGIPNSKGELEDTTTGGAGSFNNFQGRYIILHPWERAIQCQKPERGRWGGPNNQMTQTMSRGLENTALLGAPPVAADLEQLLAESVEEIGVNAVKPLDPLVPVTGGSGGNSGTAGKPAADGGMNDAGAASNADESGCSCSAPGVSTGQRLPSAAWALGLAFALGLRRFRKPS